MFKLINMKTIGMTAVSLALLAGTLTTPAFAKGAYGNKATVNSNRSHTSLKSLDRQIFGFEGHRVVGLKSLRTRNGGRFFDLNLNFDKSSFGMGY